MMVHQFNREGVGGEGPEKYSIGLGGGGGGRVRESMGNGDHALLA